MSSSVCTGLAALILLGLSLPGGGPAQTFSPPLYISHESPNSRTVLGVDVDGDGAVDIVASSADASRVGWWENVNGDASQWFFRAVASDLQGVLTVTAADFDGDGDLDLATGSHSSNTVIWVENLDGLGSSWASHPVASGFDGPSGFAVSDLDGDETPDLIGCAYGAGVVSAWLNVSGDGTSWEATDLAAGLTGPGGTGPGDLDGDGDQDIALVDSLGGDVYWVENTAGDGRHWAAHEILLNFGTAAGVTAVDLDGDGDLDVLSGGIHFVLPQRNRVAWFENVHGDGRQWVEQVIWLNLPGPIRQSAGDIDLDGDVDVLSVIDNGSVWLENLDGSGRSWRIEGLDGRHGGLSQVSVALADLDGDGDLDAIGGGYGDFANPDVAWYENLTSPAVTADEIANHLLGRVTPHPASLDVNADTVIDAADLVAVEP